MVSEKIEMVNYKVWILFGFVGAVSEWCGDGIVTHKIAMVVNETVDGARSLGRGACAQCRRGNGGVGMGVGGGVDDGTDGARL